MNPRPDFCPGCGAQVYPEEAHCPFCGRKLHTSFVLPFLVGLGGTGVALAAGGLVWWVMSAPAPQQAAAPAAPAAQVAAAPAQPAGMPGGAVSGSGGAVSVSGGALSGKDQQSLLPPGTPQTLPPRQTPAAGPSPAEVKEAALPLPTVNSPVAAPAADAGARRAFAKSKQESFAQNGLDLTVSASGEDATTLTIKFNFPAKTAAELIVAGPFPKQCEQRGFRQVLFVDPSGITWVYDVATQQMTQK
ncbi:zinc ribbon domain-containing protein [Xanthobacter sp. AM11]|uniref:zinc ribbon domain-containing protein n=1 Tax=Xanthobacter sp. AM11 TaxID=3380643 RepID=UPI0039BEFAB0